MFSFAISCPYKPQIMWPAGLQCDFFSAQAHMQASVSPVGWKLKALSCIACAYLWTVSLQHTHGPWQTKASFRFQRSTKNVGGTAKNRASTGNLMPTGLSNVTDVGLNQSIHILMYHIVPSYALGYCLSHTWDQGPGVLPPLSIRSDCQIQLYDKNSVECQLLMCRGIRTKVSCFFLLASCCSRERLSEGFF